MRYPPPRISPSFAAHTAALTAGGRTVAVIGTGIDRVYTPQNAGLQEEIAAKGLVISQFLPGSPPTKASFPRGHRFAGTYRTLNRGAHVPHDGDLRLLIADAKALVARIRDALS